MISDPAKGSSGDSNASLWYETTIHVADLLTHYSFDLGENNAQQLADSWQSSYSANWVRWAVIEALYQGRYKAVSVEQILQLWQRRQQPCYHFNYEFERLVCNNFPRNLSQEPRSKPVRDTILPPPLPVPNRSGSPVPKAATPIVSESPPWAELAEQIQQEDDPPQALESKPVITPLNVKHLEPPEILLDRVARLQAGVEALIEQATSSLNASTEAMTTKLHPEENKAVTASENVEPFASDAPLELAEEVHPPIHQFMPSESEFHSKLKAVVEQETIE
ncbi:hypothetical protein [Leptolyngbya sp. FACHB-17]|uniref:hypothetical protein n=1 Tax=unclassified Leptolyngbya TaxID=2650499 RepID=UPI001680989A|nr:hypothetical protein [Leptolyngbya sp. FACHB-17]MBD2080669.1 hypothetical protein [Leptolyngbya sp. FACHB-17]